MKLPVALHVYWPVFMAGATVLISTTFDPAKGQVLLPFSFDGGRLVAPLTSWGFLLCLGFTIAGIVYARRVWARRGGVDATERMVAMWFLMNATWFHIGCDVMSGLFQIMPNLTEAYISMNASHLQPMHHPDRLGLDVVYWFELLVQAPLCWVAVWATLTRPHRSHILVAFLSGLHLTGTVAYYAPNLLLGHTSHPLMSNLDRGFGAVWILVPALLTYRAFRQQEEATSTLAAQARAAS